MSQVIHLVPRHAVGMVWRPQFNYSHQRMADIKLDSGELFKLKPTWPYGPCLNECRVEKKGRFEQVLPNTNKTQASISDNVDYESRHQSAGIPGSSAESIPNSSSLPNKDTQRKKRKHNTVGGHANRMQYSPHCNTNLDAKCDSQSVLCEGITRWVQQITTLKLEGVDFILRSVKHLVDSTVEYMASNEPVCFGAEAILFGSMAEGTRVVKADEFDFLVVLPILSNPELKKLKCSYSCITVYFVEEQSTRLIGRPSADYWNSGYNRDLVRKLKRLFKRNMQNHFPPGWKLAQYDHFYVKDNQAFTFHVEYEGCEIRNCEVSIDITFCIPLTAAKIDDIMVDRTDFRFQTAAFLRQLKHQCEINDTTMMTILTNEHVCHRYSFLSQITELKKGSPFTNCYLLAKIICKTFIPKVEKRTCSKCVESLLPSYFLKTCVLYLKDNYKDERQWIDSELWDRLIEIFEIILYSVQSCRGEFYDHKAFMVILPQKIEADGDKMQYSPSKGVLWDSNRNSSDSFLAEYARIKCFIPLLTETANVIDSSGYSHLKAYLDYLSSSTWTLKDVLEKFVNFLNALKIQKMEKLE